MNDVSALNRQATSMYVQKFGLLSCIQCGRCSGGCPVSIKSPLNIRRVVAAGMLDSLTDPERLGLWECTTCTTCNLRCPKQLKPVDLILGLRSEQIEKGRMQTTVQAALESTYLQGNPWSRARENRLAWIGDLEVRLIPEGGSADVFLYVCCTACYDPTVAKSAQALVRLLQRAGVDFGIIGTGESCCGSEILRLGERGLFEELASNNLKLLSSRRFKEVVVLSPHCYNTFRNEYPGFPLPVKHYTQYLAELLAAGRLSFGPTLSKIVTYQDPCFLGKQNQIYDEPRRLLRAIGPKQFVEYDRSRQTSLCCEGGGGRMWVEGSGKGRLAEARVQDAVSIGAKTIASACPFCLLTLLDAVKTTGHEGEVQVRDLAELLVEASPAA